MSRFSQTTASPALRLGGTVPNFILSITTTYVREAAADGADIGRNNATPATNVAQRGITYLKLAERCSACFWCSLNSVSPVSSSDFSSPLLAEGMRVVFRAPLTVL